MELKSKRAYPDLKGLTEAQMISGQNEPEEMFGEQILINEESRFAGDIL